jgi:hypothetical protein
MKSSKEHAHYGCLTGAITVRPMTSCGNTTCAPSNDKLLDTTMIEGDCARAKPSNIVVSSGKLASADGLRVAIDVNRTIAIAAKGNEPTDMCRDDGAVDTSNLQSMLGAMPMFRVELPLVEQAMNGGRWWQDSVGLCLALWLKL